MSNAGSDRYAAIEDGSEVELRVKGSRFLGRALQVAVESDVAERLRAVRRAHHSATHHCWALRLGPPAAILERFDDDGEPAGTAGRPILGQLRSRELHDALLVVTRYFGGTKLGTGGLARAYGDAAAQAISASPPRTVTLETAIDVSCNYDDVGAVEATLARAGEDLVDTERRYRPVPRWLLRVRRSRAASLAARIVDATAGRAEVRLGRSED